MARSLSIRQPHAAEIRLLHKGFEETLTPGQCRRAEAILLYAAGLTTSAPQTIAMAYGAEYESAHGNRLGKRSVTGPERF
jgi:hypothetical protein